MDRKRTYIVLKGCQYGCIVIFCIIIFLFYIVVNTFQEQHETSGSHVETYQRMLERELEQSDFKGDIKVNYWHRTAFSHMVESIGFTYLEADKFYDFDVRVYRGNLDKMNYGYYGQGISGLIKLKLAEKQEQFLIDRVKSVLKKHPTFKLDDVRLIDGHFISNEHKIALNNYQKHLQKIDSIHDDVAVEQFVENGAKVFSVGYVLKKDNLFREIKINDDVNLFYYHRFIEEINQLKVNDLIDGTYVFYYLLENTSGGYENGVKKYLILYIQNGQVVKTIEQDK